MHAFDKHESARAKNLLWCSEVFYVCPWRLQCACQMTNVSNSTGLGIIAREVTSLRCSIAHIAPVENGLQSCQLNHQHCEPISDSALLILCHLSFWEWAAVMLKILQNVGYTLDSAAAQDPGSQCLGHGKIFEFVWECCWSHGGVGAALWSGRGLCEAQGFSEWPALPGPPCTTEVPDDTNFGFTYFLWSLAESGLHCSAASANYVQIKQIPALL